MKRLSLIMIVLGGFLGYAATANRNQDALPARQTPRLPHKSRAAIAVRRLRSVGTLPKLCNVARQPIIGRTTGRPCTNGSH